MRPPGHRSQVGRFAAAVARTNLAARITRRVRPQRRVLLNGLYGWCGLGVSTLVLLALTPLLLRMLGPEQFGTWTLMMSIVGIAGFADQGLGVGSGTYVAHYASTGDNRRLADTITAAILIAVAVGLIIGACLYLVAPFVASLLRISTPIHAEQSVLLQLSAVGVMPVLIRTACMAAPVGLQRYEIVVTFGCLQSALPWLIAVVLASRGFGIVVVMIGSVAVLWAVAGLSLGVACLALARTGYGPRISLSHAIRVTRYSMVSMGAGVGTQMFDVFDRVTVGAVLGPGPLAYYAIATGVARKLNQLLGVFWQPLMPASTALLAARDRLSLRRQLIEATAASAMVNVVVATVAIIASGPLVELWLGSANADPVLEPLRILIVVYGVFSVAAPAWHVALGVGEARACAITAFVGGTVSVGLIIPLGLALGVTGAALANGAYALNLVLVPYLLNRLRFAPSTLPAPSRISMEER